jgi:hypothetical protein
MLGFCVDENENKLHFELELGAAVWVFVVHIVLFDVFGANSTIFKLIRLVRCCPNFLNRSTP